MSKEDPVPIKSFVALAVLIIFLFAPRVIERTDTTCDAVSAQVVNMLMKRVTEAEMARLGAEVPGHPTSEVARDFVPVRLRHELAEKIAPKLGLANSSWYSCSILYWVNFVNPPPP